MTEFKKLEYDIVKFMRGNYRLDEVPGKFYGVPCVRFKQGSKTVVSINLYEDYYEFLVIFGKEECHKFEPIKHEFPVEIQDIYDTQPSLHDGKWMVIRVDNLQMWEAVKRMILLKKKPNRKPLPKEGTVIGKCGHRCDLCVHNVKISEEFRESLIPHLDAVYGENSDWSMRCEGCETCSDEVCETLKCLKQQKKEKCADCEKYPCKDATVGYKKLEHRKLAADDVTWAILPYVPGQYE